MCRRGGGGGLTLTPYPGATTHLPTKPSDNNVAGKAEVGGGRRIMLGKNPW